MPKSSSFTLPVGRDEDVRRLEVAMDDGVLVRVLHGLAHGAEQLAAARASDAPCACAVRA